MLRKMIVVMAGLLAILVVACGEASPAQQTEDAYREQTKAVENIQDGFDEDALIGGRHCTEYGFGEQFIELVKSEVGDPADFKFITDRLFDGYQIERLDAQEIIDHDIPISEEDAENERLGGKLHPRNTEMRVKLYPDKFANIWDDRARHYAFMLFTTDNKRLRANAFVDHQTCEVQLLEVIPFNR